MAMLDLMKQRHSVRQYTDRPIETEKRNALNDMITEINQKADLHIQIFYDEPKCFDSMMAHYGKFTGVRNYIALVEPKGKELNSQRDVAFVMVGSAVYGVQRSPFRFRTAVFRSQRPLIFS